MTSYPEGGARRRGKNAEARKGQVFCGFSMERVRQARSVLRQPFCSVEAISGHRRHAGMLAIEHGPCGSGITALLITDSPPGVEILVRRQVYYERLQLQVFSAACRSFAEQRRPPFRRRCEGTQRATGTCPPWWAMRVKRRTAAAPGRARVSKVAAKAAVPLQDRPAAVVGGTRLEGLHRIQSIGRGRSDFRFARRGQPRAQFDAADQAVRGWSKLWWWNADAVIEVRAGNECWKIQAGRVREWKAAMARQRTARTRPSCC
jgi:hypothetical protein